ncbi:MAG: NAD(P)/FAD-dependent oxidoreductase [Desulfosarcinaceae bacterium]|jgi:glutathione reductase (NADPH)
MNTACDYDVLVIGSGTAGQTAARELCGGGLAVGLVEHSDRPGGTCALRGCQAKKWFYEGAALVALSRHLGGIGVTSPAIAKWSQLRDAKNAFTRGVPARTVKGLERDGIDVIKGRARFQSPRTLVVDDRPLSARFFVVATGAAPLRLPIDNAKTMISSERFMELETLPRRIVFVGGGFISFEFAHFAARLGPEGTQGIILEAGPRPLGPFDAEMVALLAEASAADGIEVQCNAEVSAIETVDSAYRVHTRDGRQFEADLVVNGAGRAAAIDDLGLERAQVDHSPEGIAVDAEMATTRPHIFAAGDCAATVQLARVADAEAKVAATNIRHTIQGRQERATISYSAVPTVLFTYPQYGMVGATESALKQDNVAYRKQFEKALAWPTYRRVGLETAAYKLLVGDDGQLLGAHMLSDHASGLIQTFTLAMANRIPVTELYRQSVLTPYPSRESDLLYILASFSH